MVVDQSELTTDKPNKGESCTHKERAEERKKEEWKGVGRRGKMVCSKYTQVINHHGVTISYLY